MYTTWLHIVAEIFRWWWEQGGSSEAQMIFRVKPVADGWATDPRVARTARELHRHSIYPWRAGAKIRVAVNVSDDDMVG